MVVKERGLSMDVKGATLAELIDNMKKWAKEHGMDVDEGDFEDILSILSAYEPQQVIFCKTGTYQVTYKTSQLGVANWNWTYEAQGGITV